MINQTLQHAEIQVWRAVTGGVYNFPKAYGEVVSGLIFPTVGSIPQATPKNGTIISQGKNVRGFGTLFMSQMKPGDYIYAKNVVRRIKDIISDTLLVINQAFPTDITSPAVTPMICEPQTYSMVYIKNTHASTSAILQEALIAAQAGQSLSGGSPLSYDASSGGTLEIEVHK